MSIRTLKDLEKKVAEYGETQDEYLMREIIIFAIRNLSPAVYEIIYGEPPCTKN